MKAIPFESVDNIYQCGEGVTVKSQSVRFPELQRFSLALDNLCNALGEDVKNDFWVSIIRKLKRFRFDICAAPLDDDYIKKIIAELNTLLTEKEHLCNLEYPNESKLYTIVIKQLEQLSKCDSAQLLAAIPSVTIIVRQLPPII